MIVSGAELEEEEYLVDCKRAKLEEAENIVERKRTEVKVAEDIHYRLFNESSRILWRDEFDVRKQKHKTSNNGSLPNNEVISVVSMFW